jgi:hypothetical protein
VDIYVLNKFTDKATGVTTEYGRDNLDSYVSNLEGYTVTNKYSVVNGVTFFENYSEDVSTIVTAETIVTDVNTGATEDGFKLVGVPVIGYKYAGVESQINDLLDIVKIRKAYIEAALDVIEDQFTIDLKFYNTYGPGRVYTLNGSTPIDRVNLSMKFNIALKKASDDYTKEYIIKYIKEYIEDLEKVGQDFHIPNLISSIYQEYSNSIQYIEFKGFNNYGTDNQHLYYTDSDEITTVPEFTCININDDGDPDISINIL